MKELSKKLSIIYICVVTLMALWFGLAYQILNQLTSYIMGIAFGLFIYPIFRVFGEKLVDRGVEQK